MQLQVMQQDICSIIQSDNRNSLAVYPDTPLCNWHPVMQLGKLSIIVEQTYTLIKINTTIQ